MADKYCTLMLAVMLVFFVPAVIANAQAKINFSKPITYPAGPRAK
jgi:putative effector of murein hydrolase LrgA (UPF0299 family)